MAEHLRRRGPRGQFFILSAFLVGMYIFFILRMFTSTRTAFEVPEVPEVNYILDAAQDALNEEGTVEPVMEAINFIQEPVGLRCTALSTGASGCDLHSEEWSCGVNLTVVYRGSSDLELTRQVYRENFDLSSTRTPIYVISVNQSTNLLNVSADVPVTSGVLRDTSGKTLRASWDGSTVTFRANLIKGQPKVVHLYHTASGGSDLHKEVGVLNGNGYDASVLYNLLDAKRDAENLTLSDLSELENGAGPRMLFMGAEYPYSYGNDLLDYVAEGGIVVAPMGLCSSESCLVGNREQLTGGHTLTAVDSFDDLNPPTTNSDYFTDADIPWLVYNSSGTTNSSRAAVGAVAYGEGYAVFVGNASMLSTWGQLGSFLDDLLAWGVPPVSPTVVVCPDQSP